MDDLNTLVVQNYSKKMKQPKLFIIGQPKSGTTALAQFLDEHPEVFISKPKEPGFFCKDFHKESDKFYRKKLWFEFRNLSSYIKIYSCSNKKINGEASTNYAYSKTSSMEIYKFNPKSKIILMLREPVSFLHSWHSQCVNETAEDIPDFEKAIDMEKDRRNGKNIPLRVRTPSYLFYSERIKYAEQLRRFLQYFPKDQVKVIIFDDFKKDNAKIYKEVLEFLEVDSNFNLDFKGVHESKVPKSQMVNNLFRNPSLKNIIKSILPHKLYDKLQLKVQAMLMKKEKRKPINSKLKIKLMKRFKPEVVKLEKLLHKESFISKKRSLINEWGYDKI